MFIADPVLGKWKIVGTILRTWLVLYARDFCRCDRIWPVVVGVARVEGNGSVLKVTGGFPVAVAVFDHVPDGDIYVKIDESARKERRTSKEARMCPEGETSLLRLSALAVQCGRRWPWRYPRRCC